MRQFLVQLERSSAAAGDRVWSLVLYDQLHGSLGMFGRHAPERLGIVLVESDAFFRRRPYHKQKLAYMIASQRQFALEQAARGVRVHYVTGDGSLVSLVEEATEHVGPLTLMRPAEWETRQELSPLIERGLLHEIPHEGWLTQPEDFDAATRGKKAWRMDAFYRYVRRKYAILIDSEKKPVGGKWSLDAQNREPWRGDPPAPEPPAFTPDEITREACEEVATRFGEHPGELRPEAIPARHDEVESLWSWVKAHCMHHFGPYEDAMSTRSRQLFHTRTAALINLHRLLPHRVIDDVLGLDIPLNSQEGFVRQVLGWREFVRHIHLRTEGFRLLDAQGGRHAERAINPAPASPSALGAARPLPPVYWGTPSGLHCLDQVVSEVWEDAYTHHIGRLMVLSNWATLLDLSPRELTDWFWVAFEDAYDWVVEPNVLGMGTFATADLMVTKPYVSGSAYINKMSDYCGPCSFNPKKDCPMTSLYWDFLSRHEDRLAKNPRMRIVMAALRKRSQAQRRDAHKTYLRVVETLEAGQCLSPAQASLTAAP